MRCQAASGTDLGACELVLGELLANAVRHAPPGKVIVTLDWAKATPTLRVTDPGAGFTAPPTLPAPTAERGRGLYLVKALAAEPSVKCHADDGCTVTVELPARRKLAS